MASRCFLVLFAVALLPFAMARQVPTDTDASEIEPQGLRCIPRIISIGSEGEDVYQTTGLRFCPPPPPAATPPAPTPAPTPVPVPAPSP